MFRGRRKVVPRDSGRESLAQWRENQLVAAGFDEELARSVARQKGVDFHRLLALIDAGCPPDLAARILAPL
jgi:hypothetical protein